MVLTLSFVGVGAGSTGGARWRSLGVEGGGGLGLLGGGLSGTWDDRFRGKGAGEAGGNVGAARCLCCLLVEEGGLEGVRGSPKVGIDGNTRGGRCFCLERGLLDAKAESENTGGRAFDNGLDGGVSMGLLTRSASRRGRGVFKGFASFVFEDGFSGVECKSWSSSAENSEALGGFRWTGDALVKPSAPESNRRRFAGRSASIRAIK